MNSGFMSKAFFALIVLLFVLPVHAAWYQVEIIVFEHLSPSSNGELWYENPGLPDRSNSIELITALADNEEDATDVQMLAKDNKDIQQTRAELIPYLQLAEDKLRLEGIQRVLKLSREYRPLMHVSWQQPGLTSTSVRAVHIQKFEEPESLTMDTVLNQADEGIDAISNEMSLSEDVYQVLDLIFDGTIRLRSSRFLHVDVDIAYFPEFLSKEREVNNEHNSLFVQQQADYVRLQESRKIRLNEIHYFDHPIFGVIFRASRLSLN